MSSQPGDKERQIADGTRFRVACIPLQAADILGLLNGTLMVDPEGPQVLADTELYLFIDGDAIAKQLDMGGATFADGRPKTTDGIWLGITAANLPEVAEGGVLPRHEVRFVATNGGNPN